MKKILKGKILTGILIISAILISGCVSSVNPVSPEDVFVNVTSITIKEFQEQDLSVKVSDNGTEPIDMVKAASFDQFTVVSSGLVNVPARTKDELFSAFLNFKIQAPSFKTDTKSAALVISYASGKDEKGEPIVKTKSVPVQTTVLPNAVLQFVGFVKGPQNISEAEVTYWEIKKGGNATITFSVKNEGTTTIDKETLKVLVDISNKEIGSNSTIVIREAMAKGGTSYTEAVVLPVFKNAPNGETDVVVTLLMGDNVIDSKTLQLKVLL